MDRTCGVTAAAAAGRRLLSEPSTVLATPILGAPLSRELVARIEAEGVRCERIAADGRIHGDADETVLAEADILLLGAVPISVLEHVLARGPMGSRCDPRRPRPSGSIAASALGT